MAACGVSGAKNTTQAAKVAGLQHSLLTSCTAALSPHADRTIKVRAAGEQQATPMALDEKAGALKRSLAEDLENGQQLAGDAAAAQNRAKGRACGLAVRGGLSSGVPTFAACRTAPLTVASILAGALILATGASDSRLGAAIAPTAATQTISSGT